MGNLAYLLVFGTILAKMGRIYRIFRNPSEQNIVSAITTKFLTFELLCLLQKGVSDWHLAIIVFIITGVGTLIPVVGWVVLNSVPSLELDLERGPDRDVRYLLFYSSTKYRHSHYNIKFVSCLHFQDRGVKIVYQVWQCTAKNNANIINITIFVFEAILQIIGVILAFQTRRVKIRVLNDYVYVSSIIYISTITIFCTAAITVALGALLNITEVAYSGALLIATTCLLGLTFIPKVVSVLTVYVQGGEAVIHCNA